MRRTSIAVSIAVIGLASLAAAALAQEVPSAVDEYTENPGSAGGDNPTQDGGGGAANGGGGGNGDSSLPSGVADELQGSGADGRAAASLAEQTAPANESNGSKGGNGDGQAGSGSGSTQTSGSGGGSSGGLGGVVDNVVDNPSDDGIGIVLPIILGAVLIGALAFLIARRRTPGEPGSA